MKFLLFNLVLLINILNSAVAYSLPSEDDIPEEVLATEIILEARSSVNNRVLSPQQYLEEKENQEASVFPPDLDPEIKHNIFLLRILKMFKTISPVN